MLRFFNVYVLCKGASAIVNMSLLLPRSLMIQAMIAFFLCACRKSVIPFFRDIGYCAPDHHGDYNLCRLLNDDYAWRKKVIQNFTTASLDYFVVHCILVLVFMVTEKVLYM